MQSSAEHRAAKTAEYRLMKLLEKGVDLVPCPACGWFQDDMVREGKRRTARWLIGVAVLCFVGGLAFTAYPVGEYLFDPEANVTPDQWNKAIIGICAGVAGAIAALFFRRMLQARVNPNVRYPKPPEPIPGMPVGIPGKAPREQMGRMTETDVSRHERFGNGLIR